MSQNEEVLTRLKRIEQLLELLTKTHLAPLLQEEFADPRMAQLYELTGSHGQREIKKKIAVKILKFFQKRMRMRKKPSQKMRKNKPTISRLIFRRKWNYLMAQK